MKSDTKMFKLECATRHMYETVLVGLISYMLCSKGYDSR